MSDPCPLDTIFLPFQHGAINWPQFALFMGAQYHPLLENIHSPVLWQVFKPFIDGLKRTGMTVESVLPDQKFPVVFCLAPKQLEEAQNWIALGLERLEDGGTFIMSAANDAFGARLKKWMEEIGFHSPYIDAKNKSKVFWGVKGNLDKSVIVSWIDRGAMRLHDFEDGLTLNTQPGIFSWDRIDKASRILIDHFPTTLSGHVADFGCGYGYLSIKAFKNYPRIEKITLIEADKRALDCAEKNLHPHNVATIWHDASKALPSSLIFDHIIMNPPFHTGKKTDIALGISFIANAAQSLKKGGTLSMVANTHLPYETYLQNLFSDVDLAIQKDGFKIIKAVK